MHVTPLPEQGQIVNVRGATWAVTDVRAQGLPRSPADEAEAGLTHVVRLQSLDEDRLGQELAVVWELEVGQTVAPDQGLPETISPDGFDDPNTLAAFVDAVRWGAVTSADGNAFQAPFRSGANVEAYQLEPLRRALQSARTNLLLADDVGLGKTIEAGLVMQELLLRHRARSVVVVCPPSLSLKWRDEMREKFGLEFEIVNSELMAKVLRTHGPNANPFRLFPRVIVSMAWLPSLRAQRLLRQVYADVRDTSSARRYAFDVLIVDEAHHVAPASPTAATGFRGYAVDSQRTVATRELAERCEHRLFLSATPHNGYSESFTALMEMIDGRRFKRGANLDERALRDIAIRRLKADLADVKGFRTRELKTLPFTPSKDEAEKFALLDQILADSARRNGRGKSGGLVAMLFKKRFLSSPWSFAQTLRHYTESGGGPGLEADDEDQYYQEVLGSGQSDDEEGDTQHPEFTALRHSKGSDPLVAATDKDIESLIDWGLEYENQPDARLTALIQFLDATCRPGGSWSNERVVVFTEYAETLDWIVRVLGQHGYREGRELAVIQGSTPAEEREDIRAKFSAPPDKQPVRVLVATDSAGEGIDLQAYCHRLVNFDIPFNPSRLEQRIGRIDRYGQEQTPEIYQLSPAGSGSAYAKDVTPLGDKQVDRIPLAQPFFLLVGGRRRRPVPEAVDELVQLRGHRGHLRLRQAHDAEGGGQLLQPPGRDAPQVASRHDRGQRPLGPAAVLQERREIRPGPQLRDRQLDRPRAGFPLPLPVAVAGIDPVRGHLPVPPRCSGPPRRRPSSAGRTPGSSPAASPGSPLPGSPRTTRRESAQCHLRPLRSPSLHRNHFEGSRGGRLASRRHAVLRQLSHTSTGYPIHHFRGREPSRL